MIYVMSDSANYSFPYVNRDVSWMYFNHRILQGGDAPRSAAARKIVVSWDIFQQSRRVFQSENGHYIPNRNDAGQNLSHERNKARQLFSEITEIDSVFTKEYGKSIADVEKILADNNILILNETQLSEEQKHYVKCLFREEISGFISPQWLDKLAEFSRESDDRIYLAIELSGNEKKAEHAIIQLPVENAADS